MQLGALHNVAVSYAASKIAEGFATGLSKPNMAKSFTVSVFGPDAYPTSQGKAFKAGTATHFFTQAEANRYRELGLQYDLDPVILARRELTLERPLSVKELLALSGRPPAPEVTQIPYNGTVQTIQPAVTPAPTATVTPQTAATVKTQSVTPVQAQPAASKTGAMALLLSAASLLLFS